MAPPTRIANRQHPIVRDFRRVAARTGPGGLVLLDGTHLLREALSAGLVVRVVLCDERHTALAAEAATRGADVYTGTRAVLDAASPVRTPSGLVALAEWMPAPAAAAFSRGPALVVGLIDVQDPGNVGSTIRSADALGATGLLAVGDSADPAGWKALRGSMGSAFRLPVSRCTLEEALSAARQAGARVMATTTGGGVALPDLDLTPATLVLFGHEGLGLPRDVVDAADTAVSIPMRPGIDSLNVAVAAALVLDAARRQREAA